MRSIATIMTGLTTVFCLTWSPTGAWADAIDTTLTLEQQEAEVIEPARVFPMPSRRVTTAAFVGTRGERLALTAEQVDDALALFDADSGERLSQSDSAHRSRTAAYAPEIEAIAPDGSFFVTTGGLTLPSVTFVNDQLSRGQPLKGHPFKGIIGRPGSAASDVVSRVFALKDSKTLLSVTNSGELLFWLRSTADGFAPREPHYARISDRYRSGRLESMARKVTAVALAPDEKTLVIGLEDGRVASYRLPKPASGGTELKPTAEYVAAYDGPVTALAFGPGGTLAVAVEQRDGASEAEPTAARVLMLTKDLHLARDLVAGVGSSVYELINHHPSYVVAVATSPESAIRVWSRRTGKLIATARIERDPDTNYLSSSSGPFDPINRALLAHDGRHLVTGSDGGNLTVWRLPKLKAVATTRTAQQIRALTLSPDGQQIVTGAHLGDARLFAWSSLVR